MEKLANFASYPTYLVISLVHKQFELVCESFHELVVPHAGCVPLIQSPILLGAER